MSANLNVMTWKTWPILVKGSLVSIFKTIGILSDSGQDYKVIKREKIGESCFLLLNKATHPPTRLVSHSKQLSGLFVKLADDADIVVF